LKELLIDGDILLYQYGCTNQTTIDWGEGIKSEWSELATATAELDSFLAHLMLQTSTKQLLICFSSIIPPSFRYEILPTYKHNRIGKEKPKLYYALRQYIIDNYPCKTEPGLEADDLLGILATTTPGKYIIASTDKDLKQIPGQHYNWRTKKKFTVTDEDADRWFYTQVLTGDTCDGYSGCPGIGPKKAYKIFTECDLLGYLELDTKGLNRLYWSSIIDAYQKAGLTEEDALTQARVARILRNGEYDFEKRQIKYWSPTSPEGESTSDGLS
jgi:DNA polymerase-1